MQHQVPAVIVAVAQHARLGGKLLGDRLPFLGERAALGLGQHRAPVVLDEMPDEEVELPGQLLDVERDPIRQVPIGLQLGAPPLQQRDERDGFPVQGRVLGRRRRAEMRLQRHVAQVLERHDAVGIRVAENRRDRQRDLLEQRGHVREGQRLEVDASPRAARARLTRRRSRCTRK